MTDNDLVTCNKCGWVHFTVTLDYATKQVQQFNEYYNTLTVEKQQMYYNGKPSSVYQYFKCMSCGNDYKNFRPFREGDCPDGVTINPILQTNTQVD